MDVLNVPTDEPHLLKDTFPATTILASLNPNRGVGVTGHPITEAKTLCPAALSLRAALLHRTSAPHGSHVIPLINATRKQLSRIGSRSPRCPSHLIKATGQEAHVLLGLSRKPRNQSRARNCPPQPYHRRNSQP